MESYIQTHPAATMFYVKKLRQKLHVFTYILPV